ncbi:MAG: hypothetical protein H6Q14_2957 [Bacteroidetes bacterium]|nr:hypothetical protein [Bacteroidota bacterium]
MRTQKHILSLSFLVSSWLSFFSASSQNAEAYSTQPLQAEIHSLQLLANNTWGALPILQLGTSDYLVVSFDRTNTSTPERFRYKLIHCNADWMPSGLIDMEYLDGFNDNLVDDYANSQTTTIDYVNYRIRFPNENARLKLSGNYVLLVYEEDNPSEVVLSACFYVLDNQVNVSSGVTSNTDFGMNKAFQQVSFTIDPLKLQIRDPYVDIKTIVMQNRRRDNLKIDVKPTFLNSGRLIYEHNPNLIFDAGNEYRRFEFVSTKSGGMNVERFRSQSQKYTAWISQDKTRAGASYLYDQDQDGRFFIRNYDGADSDVDADYVLVNFSLKADYPLQQPLYLAGDFSYGNFSEDYRMKYNEMERVYELSVFLKLGSYNYMYLTNEKGPGSTKEMEGNYYQTENEYLTLVYYRPIGQRYDSLIGYSVVKSQ